VSCLPCSLITLPPACASGVCITCVPVTYLPTPCEYPTSQAVEAGLSLERIRSYLLAPEVRPLPPLPDSTCDEENKSKSRGKHQYEPKLLPPPPPPTEAATEVVGATGAVRTPLRIADSSFSAGRSFSPGGPAFGGSEYGGDSRSQQQGIHGGDDNDEAPRLELQHATFEWDAGVPLLEDVSLSVKQGELCSVVGSTGSGKSGLLAAILGELEPTGGTVTSRGSIAYVAQVAWIQNASLKDNVLFGKAFDAERYKNKKIQLWICRASAILLFSSSSSNEPSTCTPSRVSHISSFPTLESIPVFLQWHTHKLTSA